MAQRKSQERLSRGVLPKAAKPSRAELLAELDRIRAITPPGKPGVTYPTAEELIRDERDN